ncbi:MAG: DUF4364 family protein [Lachnospiraceae bacterium]|nr:DUF4364 family protein [Lachnospiraceae bacterium]
MQSESMMLYKLILLYILDRVTFPITNTDLTTLVVDKGYATFLDINEALEDLIDDKYIEVEEIHNAFLYHITDSGRETLSFFYTKISVKIRDEIDTYLSEKDYLLREMVAQTADYYEAKKNEFVVDLRVVEHESEIIHINLMVTTEKEADTICNHWKDRSSDIYSYLLTKLISDRDPQ